MKGYVYLTPEKHLFIKSVEYIEQEDPGFFGNNKAWIWAMWKFDSENEQAMDELMRSLMWYKLRDETVMLFCKNIGYNYDAFVAKAKAEKINGRFFDPTRIV